MPVGMSHRRVHPSHERTMDERSSQLPRGIHRFHRRSRRPKAHPATSPAHLDRRESMPAIRRTAALGDTWYPFGSNPKFWMDTIETFVARRDKLFTEAERLDRDPTSIGLAYNCAFTMRRRRPTLMGVDFCSQAPPKNEQKTLPNSKRRAYQP